MSECEQAQNFMVSEQRSSNFSYPHSTLHTNLKCHIM